MKKEIRSSNLAVLLGSLFAYFLISARASKTRKASIIKKWVNWPVKFPKNTSNFEKKKEFIRIQRYILNYLSDSEVVISYLKISYNSNASISEDSVFVFRVDIGSEELLGIPDTGGTRTIRPVPPPPLVGTTIVDVNQQQNNFA